MTKSIDCRVTTAILTLAIFCSSGAGAEHVTLNHVPDHYRYQACNQNRTNTTVPNLNAGYPGPYYTEQEALDDAKERFLEQSPTCSLGFPTFRNFPRDMGDFETEPWQVDPIRFESGNCALGSAETDHAPDFFDDFQDLPYAGVEESNKRFTYYVNQGCHFHPEDPRPGPSTGAFTTQRKRALVCPSGTQPRGGKCVRVHDAPDALKMLGAPGHYCPVGNPVHPYTGNKYQREIDYRGAGPMPLVFERHYNSDNRVKSELIGFHWRHSYDRSILLTSRDLPTAVPDTAVLYREDGKVWYFVHDEATGAWVGEPDVLGRLTRVFDGARQPAGWTFVTANDEVESYDDTGRLLRIISRPGFAHTLAYDSDGRLETVTDTFDRTLTLRYQESALDARVEALVDPAGQVIAYHYDERKRLQSVLYPDDDADDTNNPIREYRYEHPDQIELGFALTSIIDENGLAGQMQPFASFAYYHQPSHPEHGMVMSSEHAGGADKVTLVYDFDVATQQLTSSTVTDAFSARSVYGFEVTHGVALPSTIDSPCAVCGTQSRSSTWDASGFPDVRTDFNGNTVDLDHDGRGLETRRTEDSGTVDTPSQRVTETDWHPQHRLPVELREQGKTTSFEYYETGPLAGLGLLARRIENDRDSESPEHGRTRVTTFEYYDSGAQRGLLKRIDGPRTDVPDNTEFFYHPGTGNLWKVVNALGHETELDDYDAHGRPGRITDPNQVATLLTYDARGRLTSRTLDAENNHSGFKTDFLYFPNGTLARVTLPDASFLDFAYDGAQRLERITDREGNVLQYTLDALGNRIKEQAIDDAGVLRRNLTRLYNTLNQLDQELRGDPQLPVSTGYLYDLEGNLELVLDPRQSLTENRYDALNRLKKIIAPVSNGETVFDYDARDNLIRVTDPRSLETVYTYSGLDNLVSLRSPDSGITSYTHDDAGNRTGQTDARGVMVVFRYDALNRLTNIDYPSESPMSEDVVLTYDQDAFPEQNGKGRLTTMSDQSGATQFSYDARGNLTAELRTFHTADAQGDVTYSIGHSYDAAGHRVSITYPSGVVVTYHRDSLGRIDRVELDDGQSRNLATDIGYLPFGPLTTLTFGNGLLLARDYDLDYRLVAQRVEAVQDTTIEYEKVDIDGLLHPTDNIQAIRDGTDPSGERDQTFAYDELNRLTVADGIYGARAFGYDALGNRIALTKSSLGDGFSPTIQATSQTYVYNQANRLSKAYVENTLVARYSYNGKGERVMKDVPGGNVTHYHYDQSGNLIAETDGDTGETLREYIYLDGLPLAVRDALTSELYYMHTDHLGTSKLLTDSTGTVAWQADHAPFGTTVVAPGNTIEHNLRFPGQYYDEETGLHYNFFREYDPSVGRYISSDPIGLRGGLNIYAYSANNPISNIDPKGLRQSRPPPIQAGVRQRRKEFIEGVGGIVAPSIFSAECVYGWTFEYEWICERARFILPLACTRDTGAPLHEFVITSSPNPPHRDCRFVRRMPLRFGLVCP